MQLLQGLLLGIVRLKEPFYKTMLKVEIYTWFGELSDDYDKLPDF